MRLGRWHRAHHSVRRSDAGDDDGTGGHSRQRGPTALRRLDRALAPSVPASPGGGGPPQGTVVTPSAEACGTFSGTRSRRWWPGPSFRSRRSSSREGAFHAAWTRAKVRARHPPRPARARLGLPVRCTRGLASVPGGAVRAAGLGHRFALPLPGGVDGGPQVPAPLPTCERARSVPRGEGRGSFSLLAGSPLPGELSPVGGGIVHGPLMKPPCRRTGGPCLRSGHCTWLWRGRRRARPGRGRPTSRSWCPRSGPPRFRGRGHAAGPHSCFDGSAWPPGVRSGRGAGASDPPPVSPGLSSPQALAPSPLCRFGCCDRPAVPWAFGCLRGLQAPDLSGTEGRGGPRPAERLRGFEGGTLGPPRSGPRWLSFLSLQFGLRFGSAPLGPPAPSASGRAVQGTLQAGRWAPSVASRLRGGCRWLCRCPPAWSGTPPRRAVSGFAGVTPWASAPFPGGSQALPAAL